MPSKWLLVGLALAAPWSAFIVFSARKFWRTSDDSRKARYYIVGKFWCVFVTVGVALILPHAVPFSGIPYDIAAVFWAVGTFPLALPAGYWVGWFIGQLDEQLQKK